MLGNYQVEAPSGGGGGGGGYIGGGDLKGGFLRYEFGGLINGVAYFWNFTLFVCSPNFVFQEIAI